MSKTIAQNLQAGVAALEGVSDSARLDIEILLAWALKKNRTYLFTWPDTSLDKCIQAAFDEALKRRKDGEPVAYITGEQEFWSLSFFVNPSTLIPRADTESLVETALELLPKAAGRILDLGTGTGAIALALASERPDCHVMAVDYQCDAVELAQRNREHLKIGNAEIIQSNWFENVSGQYDLIVSNPPYIDAQDIHLGQGDVAFEPRSALVAEDNGLADIYLIASTAIEYLKPNSALCVEHGWQQKNDVQNIFSNAGYADIKTVKDYGGNDRVTYGWIK